jgi:hypothetical protein
MSGTIATKKCAKCGIDKFVNQFFRNVSKKDGLASSCKGCEEGHPVVARDWHLGMEEKACIECGRIQPIEDFPLRPTRYREKRPQYERNRKCRDCVNKRKREERKAKPPTPEQELRWRMREKYGLELEEYEVLVAAQNGLCAICKNPPFESTGRLSVDHHHETGKTRGLLCATCNLGLGHFKDDPIRLMAAIQYLGEHDVLV